VRRRGRGKLQAEQEKLFETWARFHAVKLDKEPELREWRACMCAGAGEASCSRAGEDVFGRRCQALQENGPGAEGVRVCSGGVRGEKNKRHYKRRQDLQEDGPGAKGLWECSEGVKGVCVLRM